MNNKNYYNILNIPHNATQEEIKKAYRIMAMKFHPDKNTHDTSDKFREISSAYQILSNPKTKFEYDNNLNYSQKLNYNFKDPFELFNNIFSIINNVYQTDKYNNNTIHNIETALINKLYPILMNELNNINLVPTQKAHKKMRKCSVFMISDEELDKLIDDSLR
jgi:DnaJ-class molecular chaperone